MVNDWLDPSELKKLNKILSKDDIINTIIRPCTVTMNYSYLEAVPLLTQE